nr:translation initiation factor IF-2-like [Pongo abelii]
MAAGREQEGEGRTSSSCARELDAGKECQRAGAAAGYPCVAAGAGPSGWAPRQRAEGQAAAPSPRASTAEVLSPVPAPRGTQPLGSKAKDARPRRTAGGGAPRGQRCRQRKRLGQAGFRRPREGQKASGEGTRPPGHSEGGLAASQRWGVSLASPLSPPAPATPLFPLLLAPSFPISLPPCLGALLLPGL